MVSGFVLVMARIALVAWSALIALLAFGSLLAHPAPFALIAFSIGALPAWRGLNLRGYVVFGAAVATIAALTPLGILISYGAEEGGVSGLPDILSAAFWLYGTATIATVVGMLLGGTVWAPAKPIAHP